MIFFGTIASRFLALCSMPKCLSLGCAFSWQWVRGNGAWCSDAHGRVAGRPLPGILCQESHGDLAAQHTPGSECITGFQIQSFPKVEASCSDKRVSATKSLWMMSFGSSGDVPYMWHSSMWLPWNMQTCVSTKQVVVPFRKDWSQSQRGRLPSGQTSDYAHSFGPDWSVFCGIRW